MNANRRTVLIVDDERGARETLAKLLQMAYTVLSARNGEEAIALMKNQNIDAVLTDLRMPNGDGMLVLNEAKLHDIPCVVLTAYGSVETAVEAMRKGAYDFVTKPVNIDQLELMLERLFESKQLKNENIKLKKKLDVLSSKSPIIAHSKSMQNILDMVDLIAPTKSSILITGESGTGKELIAQRIHEHSLRTGPLITLHCAAIPENLLESELFGHEKGAFTGAIEQRKGRFELADQGTLFLDEIGDISPAVQVKLLRVLESQCVERIGGSTPIQTHARLITATNRQLQTMCEEGTFREDLYFRLDVVRIHLPPLRERKEDIPLLVNAFIERFSKENGKEIHAITPEAMQFLIKYRWPGNIRELRNCMERMVVLARENVLTLEDLPPPILPQKQEQKHLLVHDLDVHANERQLILQALQSTQGNRTHAATKLGVSRRTLQRKINTFKIDL